jgi:hypothetical protein
VTDLRTELQTTLGDGCTLVRSLGLDVALFTSPNGGRPR